MTQAPNINNHPGYCGCNLVVLTQFSAMLSAMFRIINKLSISITEVEGYVLSSSLIVSFFVINTPFLGVIGLI